MAIIQQRPVLEPLLQALVQKQQLDIQKQELAQRKKALDLDAEEAERTRAFERAQLEGAIAASKFFLQRNPQLAQGLGATPPESLPSAVGTFQDLLGTQAGVDLTKAQTGLVGEQGRIAGVEADVAEATKGAAVEVGNLRPQIMREEMANLRARTAGQLADTDRIKAVTQGVELTNAFQREVNALGPEFSSRLGQARALWGSGQITWGQARETVGLPKVEAGIPEESVFVDATMTQQNAEALKNQGFARMMQVSNGIINQLEGDGVRLAILPSLQRQTQSPTFDALVNLVAGTDQERLVNAQRMFGDAYRFSLSGQQSSDREALRMLNSISSQVGDSEETIAQKRALRDVMTQVTMAKAGGGMDPVRGAQMGLNAARNTGDPETIRLLEDILEETIAAQAGGAVSNAPTDPSNLGDRIDQSRVDDLINQGLTGFN